MKILFTNKVKVKFLKKYEYIAALFFLFVLLSIFSTPTVMVRTMGVSQGIIKSISLKRDSGSSIKSPRSHVDYYEIKFEETHIPYRCNDIGKIKSYGISNLVGKYARMHVNKKKKYNYVRELVVDDVVVVEKNDIGFFPFLLFVMLGIVTFVWSVWGFYITYLVSDDKRREILG